MTPSLRASYAVCRRIARQAGSNFYAGFLLLPRPQREAMDALYAFMRHTDDLADNPQPAHLRSQDLTHWRADLEHALLGCAERPGEPARPAGKRGTVPVCRNGPKGASHKRGLSPFFPPETDEGRTILPALTDAVQRYRIPHDHLRAAIDGVEMDLTKRRYETFAELERYCELVASAVGLACIHIWGFRGQEAFEPARKCGIALQLTNILRDLRDDAEQDRVYLPAADMRACGYSEDELLRGVDNQPFRRLIALEVGRAEQFYREGAALLDLLETAGRRVFGLMMSVYRAILRRIDRAPGEVLVRRVRLGRLQKLRIALRWTFLPPRAAALL